VRVLHLDTGAGWRGGQAQVLLLLREQQRQGLHVELAAQRRGVLLRRAVAAGIRATSIRGSEIDPAAVWRLRRLHRRRPFALIHSHSAHALMLGALLQRAAGIPLHLHTPPVDFPIRRQPLSRWKYRAGCQHIIAISHGVETALLLSGVPAARISVIHSGIDPAAVTAGVTGVDPRRELRWDRPASLALTVAALTDHKGLNYLVEAAAILAPRVPDLLFAVAGEGELAGALQRQAEKLGVPDRIRFLGFRRDVPDLLATADMFILPSHLEGLCTSLLDAMAFGLPIVATTAGGIPEVITHEQTGLLVPPRDAQALSAAVLRLRQDPALAVRLGGSASARIQEKFHASATASQTIELYHKLLGK
jgi:L-malate glycosyltransferase